MKAECISCANWSLKTSPMASHALAPCAFGNRWEYLPPSHTCDRYRAIDQAAAEKRVLWLMRIDNKYRKAA